MSASEFAAALETLGWSRKWLAEQLGCDPHLPMRWERGTAPVPPQIAAWLQRRVRCAERHPVPVDWRVR
jgi:ribosome-binding protein aMBF1 (putative translation factor)